MDKMFVVRNFTTREFYGRYKSMVEDITSAKFFKYKSCAKRTANKLTTESLKYNYFVEEVELVLLGVTN